MRVLAGIVALIIAATPVVAQESRGFFDRLFGTDQAESDQEQGGLLERFIEDNLSGEGRQVSVEGFAGALSGRATLDSLTVSDEQGDWLTLKDVVLDWNRGALLRGRLEVSELSATEILFPRLPAPVESDEVLTPEASGFSLPELPVSLAIDSINAARVAIGQPVFGTETEVSVSGDLKLDAGEGSANLALNKLDGSGAIRLDAAYSNQTQDLAIDLDVTEAPDGIVAGLLDLPGRPSVDFSVKGEAPITAYQADIRLATDGAERLTGRIETSQPEGSDAGTLRIVADLSGDISPVFNPAYQPFFGPDVQLGAVVTTFPDGRVDIENLSVAAASVRLTGTVRVGSDGLPDEIEITGDIASAEGTVLLPLTGPETRVRRVDLDVRFDAAEDERWTGDFLVAGLDRAGFSAEELVLRGTGRIAPDPAPAVSAALEFSGKSLDLGTSEVTEAVGEVVSGRAEIDWVSGGPVQLRGLSVEGESYGLQGDADVAFGESGPAISGNLTVRADRLDAFSGIAGRRMGGRIDIQTDFSTEPLAGFFDVTANGSSENLVVSQPQADRILAGSASLDVSATRDQSGISAILRTLETPNASLTGQASLKSGGSSVSLTGSLQDASIILDQLSGPIRLNAKADEDADRVWAWTAETSLEGASLTAAGNAVDIYRNPIVSASGRLEVDELADFAALIRRPLAGRLETDFSGEVALDLSRMTGNLTGTATDLKTGIPEADALLEGTVEFDIDAAQAGRVTTLRDSTLEGPQISLRADGTMIPEDGRFTVSGRLADASRLLAQAPAEALEFSAEGAQDGRDWRFAASAAGAGLAASAEGIALDPLGSAPAVDGKITASAEDLTVLSGLAGRRLTGRLNLQAEGMARADLSRFDIEASASGAGVGVGQAEADRLLAGDLSLDLKASREGDTVEVTALDFTTGLLKLGATGSLSGEGSRIDLEARLADIAPFAEGFSGPATVSGTVGQTASGYRLDLTGTGPGGATATTSGDVAADFGSVALNIDGSVPLGLLNTFIAPRSVSGILGLKLSVNGPPSLSSVSGTLTTSGARFIAPTARIVLNDLSMTTNLSGGQAQVSLAASVEGGGAISARGSIGLSAPFNSNLEIALDEAVLQDPRLYETSVQGNLTVSGPLAGGARIAGDLGLGETNIRIPSSGLGGAGAVPEITHLNEPPPVRGTRQRAGLLGTDGSGQKTVGPGFPLDIRITAPNRLFIRGRGLESEFAGALRVTGNTNNVVPSGGFNLVRGRLDILGQRLALEEATVTIQGSFLPTVRIRATTRAEEYTINVIVAGPVSDPEITFSSEPELPQEEVLARLIFGRGLDTLSPLQAARLALAVRTLAGRGGEGVVGNIRQGAGLADLDVTVDEAGNTAVTAGAYLSDNLYTDVTVGAGGQTELNLNLDLSQSVTVKGSVTNEGNSAIGIFFERDY